MKKGSKLITLRTVERGIKIFFNNAMFLFATDCKYTCHRRCRDDVDLDCTGGWHLERNMSVDEMSMKTLHLMSQVIVNCP